jgi:hypothetical protein
VTMTDFTTSNGQFDRQALRALWFAGRAEWEQAHEIAQDDESREGAWVHAYLHRAEGDTNNANYWYRRAGKPIQTGDLQTEWETIVTELLQHP